MPIEDVADALQGLLKRRARALGEQHTVIADTFAGASTHELIDTLSKAPRNQKSSIGLLAASASLDEAIASRSKASLDRFLFRFGAHLKTSVSQPGLTAAARLALATAAEKVFDSLPSASSRQRAEVYEIRVRLQRLELTDRDWHDTVGASRSDFDDLISRVARDLGEDGRSRSRSIPKTGRRATKTHIAQAPRNYPQRPAPNWLLGDFTGQADPIVSATANWRRAHEVPADNLDMGLAWAAFSAGDYRTAQVHLGDLLAQLDDGWGPSSGADTIRTWNWIRLVVELSAIQGGTSIDARRSSASAATFAARCLPDDQELIDSLVVGAIEDFASVDLASARAWCAYTTRLVADLGHEHALASYSNAEKARLRQAWASHLGLSPEESRSTSSSAAATTPRLREATQRLYVAARNGANPSRALRESFHALAPFLDELEGELLRECGEATDEAQRLVEADSANHRDLVDMRASLISIRESIAGSGSSLLQDFVAPVVQLAIVQLGEAMERLGDISRPQVAVQLNSSRLPFSAAAGSLYQVRFTVQNTGNAIAESIRLRVTQPEIGLDSIGTIDALGPGSQAELDIEGRATGVGGGAVSLHCEIAWSDALLQQFTASQIVGAEDQGPVSWEANDVNPYNLGTISDPHRLVGREEDLVSLDALIAGGASAYVTGHKRVGKTSLTRVLLKSLSETRGWAGEVLPLGRAIVEGQSAGDLVSALLDEILDACEDAYPLSVRSIEAVELDGSGNFARAANRWLKSVARSLPSGARVVIAIDDFDELPGHLVEGAQADALFLFLRSLVDEPWLNLILVGSEVLPTIIQKQAHKLNQVVPVSVNNFSSRESTADLVATPSKDRLEWAPEAIDRVHYLCSGNPYYETLVAQRLWQTMREQARSMVAPGDVEGAVSAVAHSAPESHFVHLWADSASGIDHTSRSAVVASAILRSVARAGGRLQVPAATDEVVRIAGTWIQTATSEELMRAIAHLRAREVLAAGPSDGSLLISIPLVAVWLLDAGNKVLDALYSTSKHAIATVRMITDSDLVSLSKQLQYRGEHISEIRLKAWLEQFGDNYHQYLAFKMLRRMILDGYFTSTKLQSNILPRLSANVSELRAARLLVRENNNQTLKNAYLVDHGVAGDSTQGTLSALTKSLHVKKSNVLPPDEIVARLKNSNGDTVLFLLDDYSGTGTHLHKTLEQLLGALADNAEAHERVHIVLGAGVVADESDLPRPESPFSIEHVAGLYLGERFRPFSPGSGVFDSEKERLDAETMTASIGNALMPSNPLGFGGKAILALFEFNCPNNAAPVFWRAGAVSGARWVPLFERAV